MISFILFNFHFCYHHYHFGIFVLPGQDWKWSDQDGGEGSVGFVYRVKEDQTVYVSIVWGNTEKGGKEFDKKIVTLRSNDNYYFPILYTCTCVYLTASL